MSTCLFNVSKGRSYFFSLRDRDNLGEERVPFVTSGGYCDILFRKLWSQRKDSSHFYGKLTDCGPTILQSCNTTKKKEDNKMTEKRELWIYWYFVAHSYLCGVVTQDI